MRTTPIAIESSQVGVKLGLAKAASRRQGAGRIADSLQDSLSLQVVLNVRPESGVAVQELVDEHLHRQSRVSRPCEEV